MFKQTKSILFLAMLSFAVVFSLNPNHLCYAESESSVPIGYDKKNTLPANDGGEDGCDSSRFKCVMGGEAIFDKETGLTWARNPNIQGMSLSWKEAGNVCENFELGNKKNWRLPKKDELMSLLDTSQSQPALPKGHPFNNVIGPPGLGSGTYWTCTECGGDSTSVWIVSMNIGQVVESLKLYEYGVWPVLAGD